MFGDLFKAALTLVVTPIDVVKDVVTLGGSLTDEKEPYTVKRLKDAGKCLDRALDPDDDD